MTVFSGDIFPLRKLQEAISGEKSGRIIWFNMRQELVFFKPPVVVRPNVIVRPIAVFTPYAIFALALTSKPNLIFTPNVVMTPIVFFIH